MKKSPRRPAQANQWMFSYASLMTLLFSVFLILYSNSASIVVQLQKSLNDLTGEDPITKKKIPKLEKSLQLFAERVKLDFADAGPDLVVPLVEWGDQGVTIRFSGGFEASAEKPSEPLVRSLHRLRKQLFTVPNAIRVTAVPDPLEVHDDKGFKLSGMRAAASVASLLEVSDSKATEEGVADDAQLLPERFEAVGIPARRNERDPTRLIVFLKSAKP